MPESKTAYSDVQKTYFPQRLGRYFWEKTSFYTAGQNSFVRPPAQNPDDFMQLTNVLPPVRGVMDRRWGYDLWANFTTIGLPSNINRLFSFQQQLSGSRQIIGTAKTDTARKTATFGENGSILSTSVGSTGARAVISRDTAFFADPTTSASVVKWNGSTASATQNWGIANGSAGTMLTFPINAFDDVGQAPAGGHTWTTPANAKTTDGLFATVDVGFKDTPFEFTDDLRLDTFGLALANTAIIFGIQVTILAKEAFGELLQGTSINTFLVKNGVVQRSTQKSTLANTWGTPLSSVTLGSPTDLWGTTWQPSDVNATNFGVALQALFGNKSTFGNTFSVDSVAVTIFASSGSIVIGAPVVGAITLNSGRTYFVAYQNSVTGHFSDLIGPSASTGVLKAQNQPLSNLPVSTDSQVDSKVLLATFDGNDQTKLALVATLANSATTFTDSMPETTLVLQNIFQETQSDGSLHGVAFNQPPPLADFPIKHRGRLFMANNRTLFFSKNTADLTTSTGLITGRFEEAWPKVNQLDVAEDAENIRGLLSDGTFLYVGTEKRILRLSGSTVADFQLPERIFPNTGIVNQECWQVVFVEGQPVGVMWLTPDLRVILSDFNTYKDVGTPIQDVLNSITQNAIQDIRATAYSDNAYDLYILAVPTAGVGNGLTKVLVYDLRGHKWYVWNLTDTNISTVFYNIDVNGKPQLIFTANNNGVFKGYLFNRASVQDRVADTPVSFTETMQTSWLDFGEPILRKVLNQIDIKTEDTGLLVTVEGASKDIDFTSPRTVVSSANLVTSPFGDLKVYLAGSASKDRFYRFTFTASGTVNPVLSAFAVEYLPIHKF